MIDATVEEIGTGEQTIRSAIKRAGVLIGENLSSPKLGRGEEIQLPGLLLEDGSVISSLEGFEESKELPG